MRGFRIELGEIEAALLGQAGINQAAASSAKIFPDGRSLSPT